MKKSIQAKIVTLIVSGLLFCTILVGGISIFCVNGLIKDNSEKYLESISEKETVRISASLENIEQYVKMLTYTVLEGLDSVAILKSDSSREAYTSMNFEFMNATIKNTSGAIAVYLRFNPSFTPPTSGIFMAKTTKNGGIEKLTPTDFSKFAPTDVEHVGWYYVPINTGKPLWMEPYENKNIDIYMISYVVPLFKFGEEIGVVGVDIDFDYLTKEISQIKAFKNGYAFLENSNGQIAYHPTIPKGKTFQQSSDIHVIRTKLPNGMYLVLAIPVEEIYAERNKLIFDMAAFTLLILIVFVLVSMIIAKSITTPLRTLTYAANKMTAGNMEVSFDITSKDEVGELAKSFAAAQNYMREYLGYIKGVAYKDSLTGVRNKTSYDNFAKDLQEKIAKHEVNEFGLAVFDVNGLKTVNDNYGHDHGNMLLINCCRLICKVFDHSPVFRIGGDEFVVVLQFSDYENREELMIQFQQKIGESATNADTPWENLSIACGLAIFEGPLDKVEAVFKRADEAMYLNKQAMKIASNTNYR